MGQPVARRNTCWFSAMTSGCFSSSPCDSTSYEWDEDDQESVEMGCGDSSHVDNSASCEESRDFQQTGGTRSAGAQEVRFSNMSATFRLNTNSINLWILAANIPGGNCIYDPRGVALCSVKGRRKRCFKNQATFYLRLKSRKGFSNRSAMIQIFSNGTISLCGVRTCKECELVARMVVNRIKRTYRIGKDGVRKYAVSAPDSLDIHPQSCGSPIRIDVVKVEFDLKAALKLEAAHRILAQKYVVSYEPEIFHGLKVSATKNATVAIYATGKAFINLNAAKVSGNSSVLMQQVNEVYTEVCGFLWKHIGDVINLSFCKPSKDVTPRT